MANVLEKFRKSGGGVIGIGNTASIIANSTNSVIIHSPRPFFIEYFRSILKREKTVNVFDTVADVFRRLDEKTGITMAAYSFLSDSLL